MELPFKTFYIVFGHNLRMDMIFDRIVFRRQSESVPSHRIKYVISLHSSFSCYDIQRRIRSRMPYMKPLSRRIRKLYKGIIFGFGIVVRSCKRFLLIPYSLPF